MLMLPSFQLLGFRVEATVETFESGLGRELHSRLLERKSEITYRKENHVFLLQMYPMDEHFDAKRDPFSHFIGFEVTQAGPPPTGMVHHEVEASEYVVGTHKGPESGLQNTYDYLYGLWPQESGRSLKCYDFEIWDERYSPESLDNEIDIYVALKNIGDSE
ncbi:GyrI-like domain-containing protein [Gorillibacterium sp. CAU 1737]